MVRSFLAAWAVALLSNHAVQGYRVNNKKLMTSPESVLVRNKGPAPDVLHTLHEGDFLDEGKEGEENAEVKPLGQIALIADQANISSEAPVWEPQGILVKMGYLRSKAILHVAGAFLPKSMMQNMPAMDAVVFEVPDTSAGPYLGLPWSSWEGTTIYSLMAIGAVMNIVLLVKFYTSILAARATPAAEGDDDSFGSALVEVVGLALPMLLAGILQMLNEMTNTIILGQNGTPVELASLGLVQSLYNCGIITICMGLNGVMDTVVAQAFGAGDQALCLTYMQRCRFLVLCLLIIGLPLFWFSEPLLVMLGQEVDVAMRTSIPAKLFWVGGAAMQMTTVSFIFLKNVGDMSTIWMFAVGNVVHLSCAFFFALHLEMGVVGIGIAMACQNTSLSLMMNYYLCNKSIVKDYPLIQKIFATASSLDGLWDYILLGVPSAISSACESWYWELNVMTIGWLGAVSLAAHSSTCSLVGTAMIICACTAGSGTTLVSRALGSGHPRAARAISLYSILTILSLWTIAAIILLVFDVRIARLFNSNPKVLAIMVPLIHIQAFASFLSSGMLIAGSVLRAMLKHKMVAIIQFFNYYIVALPVGYLLAFHSNYGVVGTYTGLMIGMMMGCSTLVGWLTVIDFDKMTEETKARLNKDSSSKKAKEANDTLG